MTRNGAPKGFLLLESLQQLKLFGFFASNEFKLHRENKTAVGTKQHLPEGLSELCAAERVNDGVDEGVAHQQHHVQLEQGAIALTVGVHGAGHDDEEVEEERCPAHHKGAEQQGQSQGSPHAAPPPLSPTTLPSTAHGQGCDLPGVDACQHEHVDVEEADHRQGDDKEDDEADHSDVGVKESHHEYSTDATRRPDDAQDEPGTKHGHDVVVPQCIEDCDVAKMKTNDFII